MLDHLQELILDGKSVRPLISVCLSIGMTSKAEDTQEKVTAACQRGGRTLIVVNAGAARNFARSKIQEYGGYTGTDEVGGGTTGGGATRVALAPPTQGGSGTNR